MSCKVVNVCGRRRKLCFGKNGKIKTNTAAGGGRKSSRKASKKSHGGAFVSKDTCLKRNGKLKKGYRFVGNRCKRAAA